MIGILSVRGRNNLPKRVTFHQFSPDSGQIFEDGGWRQSKIVASIGATSPATLHPSPLLARQRRLVACPVNILRRMRRHGPWLIT